jgi:glycine cleavage system H lipoate-binding protein
MSSILSEISSKFSISALTDKVKDVYHDVNGKVLKVKEALSEKTADISEDKLEDKSEEKKNEGYATPAAEKTTKDKIW